MTEKHVSLRVPAEASFARTVRMTASALAVAAGIESVEDVEDVKMVADEGFVYACATAPEVVEVRFSLAAGEVAMDFSLGAAEPADDAVDLVRVLLSAVCDEFSLSEDGATLHLLRATGGTDGE
ncbi:MAG: ATP-binding protein [Atopobiaceae bacterium]|nr:ATP-binding protein [Atopobiaceae bacterium]